MNKQIETYARNTLKKGLAKCSKGQQHLFKRMYANGKLDSPINNVVDAMSSGKLDWAMQQVQRTLDKDKK